MKRFLLAIASWMASSVSHAACDQTVNPGANLPAIVRAAAVDSTVCLNGGDYGSVNFSNIKRSGLVTLQSTAGLGAALSPQVRNSSFIRFQSMTLRNLYIANCSSNIQVVGNTWAQNTGGIVVTDNNDNCAATDKKIVVDGNQFVNVRPAWAEGKIGLVSVNGFTFRNNLIQGQSVGAGGDGIQTGGDLANIVIGPGNVFRDIRQAPCDASPGVPHCDAIQFVGNCPSCTITGNWFDNVEVVLQHHDARSPVVFTHNLVTKAVQMFVLGGPGNASDSRIEHNTFWNLGLAVWGTTGGPNPDTTGLVARNNILIGNGPAPATCSPATCTFSHNLCQTAAQCAFTRANAIVGTPTFVGGAPGAITTWAGWRLAAGSLGVGKASDGQDLGTNAFGPGSTTPAVPLAPPTALRVN